MLTEGQNFGITEFLNFGHAENSLPLPHPKTPFCGVYKEYSNSYFSAWNLNGAIYTICKKKA